MAATASGMVLVHVLDDLGLGRGDGVDGGRIGQQLRGAQPRGAGEAAHQEGAAGLHSPKREIAEIGI
jgi:hypothetical protein